MWLIHTFLNEISLNFSNLTDTREICMLLTWCNLCLFSSMSIYSTGFIRISTRSGPRYDIKILSNQYWKSHCKRKWSYNYLTGTISFPNNCLVYLLLILLLSGNRCIKFLFKKHIHFKWCEVIMKSLCFSFMHWWPYPCVTECWCIKRSVGLILLPRICEAPHHTFRVYYC